MYKLYKAIVTHKPVILSTVNNNIFLGHPRLEIITFTFLVL